MFSEYMQRHFSNFHAVHSALIDAVFRHCADKHAIIVCFVWNIVSGLGSLILDGTPDGCDVGKFLRVLYLAKITNAGAVSGKEIQIGRVPQVL